MSINLDNSFGSIEISDEVIATVAGVSAMDCYGLVGMASRSQIRDGIAELLGRDNSSRGIEVASEGDEIIVSMHIIVGYGTKISEVASNVQAKVRYTLNQILGLTVSKVNIFVQGVRLTNE